MKNNFVNTIIHADWIEGLKQLPDNSIDCVVTSPPYYGLRDYGVAGQIGLEETPEIFVQNLVNGFQHIKRVLKPQGTIWVNLGDSYAGGGGGNYNKNGISQAGGQHICNIRNKDKWLNSVNLKPKDLIGIPWMVAFALRADGWYLRQDIIWHKPNPMPESVTDRCTKAHEYIFLLSKSQKYYFDAEAIKTELKAEAYHMIPKGWAVGPGSHDAKDHATTEGQKRKAKNLKEKNRPFGIVRDRLLNYDSKEKILRPDINRGQFNNEKDLPKPEQKANKRSVWTVNPMPYSEAHFATFPEKLITDCIKAGCPENGIVLDPFMGAGTTAIVARKLNRNYTGIELNAEYIQLTNKRLYKEFGMFLNQ